MLFFNTIVVYICRIKYVDTFVRTTIIVICKIMDKGSSNNSTEAAATVEPARKIIKTEVPEDFKKKFKSMASATGITELDIVYWLCSDLYALYRSDKPAYDKRMEELKIIYGNAK